MTALNSIRCAAVAFSVAAGFVSAGETTTDNTSSITQATAEILACSPSRLTVAVNEKLQIRAWVPPAWEENTNYRWTTTGGNIEGVGSEATWDFAGVFPNEYSAQVTVSDGQKEIGSCQVRVVVKSPPLEVRNIRRIASRSLLFRAGQEPPNFGVYSYLLLLHQPGTPGYSLDVEARYRAAIAAMLSLVEDIWDYYDSELVSTEEDKKRFNLTLIPVKDSLPLAQLSVLLKEKRFDDAAVLVLKHYNVAVAQNIFSQIGAPTADGPLAISVSEPRSKANSSYTGPLLIQDQSGIPPELVSLWMREFIVQAQQEQYWESSRAHKLALQLRTTMTVVAKVYPEVLRALDRIRWRD